ncbi:uncharacterized protein LOC133184124 isoform X2 [Saccostrea echinata]|nr:uncharacterized protein LOC133184124 isoform X2 [Saccostrea echinata]
MVAVHLINGVLRGRLVPKVLPENVAVTEQAEVPIEVPSVSEREAYNKVFQRYDQLGKGFITGEDAVEIFKESKLESEKLASVWDWSDLNRDGQLSSDEWLVACHLLRHLKNGNSLEGVVNPFNVVPHKVSPNSLLARKTRIEEYEKHKQRLMQLKEKRKVQIQRESQRLELVKEKKQLQEQLVTCLKSSSNNPLSEEEINQLVQTDKDNLEKLEEVVARLKKEHEQIRQETVQVILGEQKLQVEHRLLKNELDELNKRLGSQHTKATKDPDPFHQLYEQRKEERKKSNLSEGEEPEVHLPFNPFDTESLHHSSVSGSHLFLSQNSLNNNNTKHPPETQAFLESLHEFGENFLEFWSDTSTSMSATDEMANQEEDPVFKTVEVSDDNDPWLGLNWGQNKLAALSDQKFCDLHRKLVDLKAEFQKLNQESGGQLVFRNPSDYLARKKEKEEEEQREKQKFPRRSKSSADKDYTAKRRSYIPDRKNEDSDAAREKRLNRRSLNLENRTEKSRAPDRPLSSHLRSDKPEPKSRTQPETETSTSTSPTRLASTKKTRAPPPPCSQSKESRIPVPSGAGNPERPPRRKKSSSGEEPTSPKTTESNNPGSPRSSFLFSEDQQGKPIEPAPVEEVFVSAVESNVSCSPESVSSGVIPEESGTESEPLNSETTSEECITVIGNKANGETVNSEHHPDEKESIIVNHLDIKLIEIVPEVSEEKETTSKVVSFSKEHTEIPNPDTVSLCSIDSIPPDLPNSAPPPLLPKHPDTASIGEEAIVIEQEVKVIEEEIVKTEEVTVESSGLPNFSDISVKDNLAEEYNSEKMSVEVDSIVPSEDSLEISASLKEEKEFKEVDSDADSDLSDILNQNGSFTPGDDKTDHHIPLNLMDDEIEDCGEIQLLSHSTSVQSPTSQADSAFEDMVNSNQVSLSSTLEDVKDEVISDTVEQVKVTLAESEPTSESLPSEDAMVTKTEAKPEFVPTASEVSYQTHSSYVTEVPHTETKIFVKKAQQFSETVNQPPKMTIRSTSKEMSDEHLQKVDGERKAVISQSMVKRRGITEFAVVSANDESKQADVKSSVVLEVNDNKDLHSPVKSKGAPINFDEVPPKVDLYSQNVVQEDGNTDTVNRESIADLNSTRKQWETILQSSGKSDPSPAKVTPKKSGTPVKHWEVKLPYKPNSSSKAIPQPEVEDAQPKKSFKMEDDPYANESAIEREIRLANEREEMLRKEQEERMELSKRQNASKNQVNTKMFENENNNTEFKTMYHEMTEADRGSELQKRETLIQQEIEEQKEREEALTTKPPPAVTPQDEENRDSSRESLIAKEIRLQKEREEEIAKRHSLKKEPEVKDIEPEKVEPVSREPEKMEAPVTNNKQVTYEEAIQEPFHHEGESLIAKELREAKEREEEIRRMRERMQGGNKPNPAPETTIKQPPKTPTQETVKKTWQQSPSVQSPKISSHTPSRSVRVQPIADSAEEDETDSKPVERKETPIEREIRIARERENELRRQKGLPLLSEVVKPAGDDVSEKSSVNEEPVSYNYRNKVNTAEGTKSMRNFATSRLQNEILKQKEREHKLRDEGKIISTSEEHIGTLKYAEVAGIPKNEGPVKRNFVTRKSTSTLPPPGDSPSSSNTPSENGDVEPPKMSPQISKEEPVKYKRPTVKTGGASFSYRESRNQAESKIEKELREMREREEELKKSRGGTLSPPTSPRDNNLSSRKAQFEQV